jgi:hypothetical protein
VTVEDLEVVLPAILAKEETEQPCLHQVVTAGAVVVEAEEVLMITMLVVEEELGLTALELHWGPLRMVWEATVLLFLEVEVVVEQTEMPCIVMDDLSEEIMVAVVVEETDFLTAPVALCGSFTIEETDCASQDTPWNSATAVQAVSFLWNLALTGFFACWRLPCLWRPVRRCL